MQKIISTENAPKAVGPYSQAVETNGFLFISGQIAINPESGEIAVGIAAQTEQVMKNIGEILTAAMLSYDNVAKCTCFLSDINDFGAMNEVFGKFFPQNPPARALIGDVKLPKGVLIEIDAIAAK